MVIVFLDIPESFTDAFAAARSLSAEVLALFPSGPRDVPHANWTAIPHSWTVEDIAKCVRSIVSHNSLAFWALKERHIPLASELNDLFGSRCRRPNARTVWTTKSKLLMRHTLDGTPFNPRYAVIQGDDSRPFKGNSLVLKPIEGYASVGVELVSAQASNDDFVRAAWRSLSTLASVESSISGHRPDFVPSPLNRLLVEEFVEGREYSVELFAHADGIEIVGICSKSPMKPPYFEEISYQMPAATDLATQERLSQAGREVARAIGLTSGMAHMEFIDGKDGPKVLDIGLRLGGAGLTHDLVKISSGVDMVLAVLSELLGKPVGEILRWRKCNTAVLYLMQVMEGGVVKQLPQKERLKMQEDMLRIEHFVKTGDRLTAYPAYSGTPGFALFSITGQGDAANRRAAAVISECLRDLRFQYENETNQIYAKS